MLSTAGGFLGSKAHKSVRRIETSYGALTVRAMLSVRRHTNPFDGLKPAIVEMIQDGIDLKFEGTQIRSTD